MEPTDISLGAEEALESGVAQGDQHLGINIAQFPVKERCEGPNLTLSRGPIWPLLHQLAGFLIPDLLN